jgi:curved DNA-binding protein CbpA
VQPDPFAELGLPALADLTDDDVRAAWRRIAAATHPDREDGGDPARFGAAAAAYAVLRTSFGRGEALADLDGSARAGRPPHGRRARRPRRSRDMRGPWDPRRPHGPQHRGAHRLRAAAPSARYRHAGDTGFLQAVYARFLQAVYARFPQAVYARFPQAGDGRLPQAGDGRFPQAGDGRFPQAGDGRYRHAGYVSIDRGLALPTGGAALAAAAAVAAAGWTPATIGLVAGALTVTAWGLWRRAGRDR